jgi:hypothetical protein
MAGRAFEVGGDLFHGGGKVGRHGDLHLIGQAVARQDGQAEGEQGGFETKGHDGGNSKGTG